MAKETRTIVFKQGNYPAKIVNRKVEQACSEIKLRDVTNDLGKKRY